MTMAKPRVFVSSTYYDLRHIRSNIEAFIESIGYEPVLFESGDIAFSHDIALDESCYREIQNAHMMILIIGGRYGSGVSGEQQPSDDEKEKFYRNFNSITKKEYETARARDIPIFIFVEKGVHAEYRTFKLNRKNTHVKYAHVDSVNVFRLLDNILSQHRNNFVREFEKFEDISVWLREQWAGLFAEFLMRQSTQVQLKDMSARVAELGQVAEALKEYTESIMRKIQPENFQNIITKQDRKILEAKAALFYAEPMIRYIIGETERTVTPIALFRTFQRSDNIEIFLQRARFPLKFRESFLQEYGVVAGHDFQELRHRYLDPETRLAPEVEELEAVAQKENSSGAIDG
jgi:hypothetical protein